MKVKLNQRVISPKGIEYTIKGIEDGKVIVQRINKAGEEVIKEFKKTTITKTWKPSTEDDKTLVEEALEEAGLSSKLGKIGDPIKDTTNKEKAPRKSNKTKLEGVISLKEILESLGIEATADYMKTLRRKLRKNDELKALRIPDYNWSFKVEVKEEVVKKLKDIV